MRGSWEARVGRSGQNFEVGVLVSRAMELVQADQGTLVSAHGELVGRSYNRETTLLYCTCPHGT